MKALLDTSTGKKFMKGLMQHYESKSLCFGDLNIVTVIPFSNNKGATIVMQGMNSEEWKKRFIPMCKECVGSTRKVKPYTQEMALKQMRNDKALKLKSGQLEGVAANAVLSVLKKSLMDVANANQEKQHVGLKVGR